jgi:uncharacterized protein YlbG (UPF0298 family)
MNTYFWTKLSTYDSLYVNFEDITTITSKITRNNLKTIKSYKVSAVTLSEIIKKYSVKNQFTLISDIEEAERNIFFKDVSSLKFCLTIIVEIEKTKKYTIKQQILQIKKLGFRIVEFYNNVYVFSK